MKTFFKTGKKALSLFLSMLMIMTTCVFFAPAADTVIDADEVTQCACGSTEFTDTTVAPTCTQEGFVMRACKNCGTTYRTDFKDALSHNYDWDNDGKIDTFYSSATCTSPAGTTYKCSRKDCGFSYFVADEGSEALRHEFSDWYFVKGDDGGTFYYKKRNCDRQDICSYVEYEMVEGSTTEKQKYYKVDYINEYVTDTTETASDKTVLAKTFKTETLETVYVKENGAAEYTGKTPARDKTEEYGKYEFAGWAVNTSSLDEVTSNITASALFTGKEVTYHISFAGYSNNEQQAVVVQYTWQHVAHGGTIQYDPADILIPTYDVDNLHYRYTFSNWDLANNVTETKIYSDHTVNPVFTATPKTYKVVYHDYDGTVLGETTFEYGTRPTNVPTGLTKANDETYIYEYTNKWTRTAGGTDYVNIDALTVPVGTAEYDASLEDNEYLFDNEKGIIHIYAELIHKAREYKVRIVATDIDDSVIPGASVQITGSKGFLVTQAVLDEDSQVVVSLPYDSSYNITVTANGNVGSSTITGEYLLNYDATTGNIPNVRIQLQKGSDVNEGGSNHCTCICHSFLSRFHITILNLVYRLFGKKIVCCYDMYATHGDTLVYGA